jgi:hypothetical protein
MNYFSSTVSILLGKGDGTFTAQAVSFAAGVLPPFSTPSPQAMTVVDFNGDGKPGLAVVDYATNSVTVLTNTTP